MKVKLKKFTDEDKIDLLQENTIGGINFEQEFKKIEKIDCFKFVDNKEK